MFWTSDAAMAAITASSITGPATLEPGKTATFNYRLAGQDSVTSTTPIVIYLSNSTIAPGLSSERIGGFNAPLDFQAIVNGFPRYKAPANALPTSQTVPAELSDSSWPVTVRFKGTIPPGNYYVVLFVLNTFASYQVTVQPMTITGFTPANTAVGQQIQISGAFLDRADQVFINGTEVFSFDWSYSSTSGKITAKVPDALTVVGKVEVRNPVQTVQSTGNFSLSLPDMIFATNAAWGGQYVISHHASPSSSSQIYTGATSSLSVLVKNNGTLATKSSSIITLAVDGTATAATFIPSSFAIGALQVVTLTVPKLTAGNHSLVIIVDESTFSNRETNETNNTLTIALPVVAHPVDTWRTARFSAADLSNPAKEATVYGDDADPDGDGVKNLAEMLAGTDPLQNNGSNTPNWPVVAMNGVYPNVSYFQASGSSQVAVNVQVSDSLNSGTWTTPILGTDYQLTTTPVLGGQLISLQFASDYGGHAFFRTTISRVY